MQNIAGNILTRMFDPFLDYFITWLTVNIALIAQVGFFEDDDGNIKRMKGSGAILIVNHGREPIKISDLGLILKDKTRFSLTSNIAQGEEFPAIIPGKDHKSFLIKREVFQKLRPAGINSIRKVYIEDSMLNTITSSVPMMQKNYIAYSVFAPKEVKDA